MNVLGLGFFEAEHYEDALSVLEAELSMRRPGVGTVDRVGVPPTCDASEAYVVGS